MNIEEKLTTSIISAIKTLYGQDVPGKMVQLQKTKKEFEGHLTLVVFPFLKMSKKGPEQTAQEIGGYLKEHAPELVSAYNAVKGFLNLTIASDCWIELLNSIQAAPEYGIEKATENSPLVMIEYSSPNTNKPLHLGHVRNNLLGNALANVMAANGNKVVKTNIVNDRGIHICKSMLAWLKYGNGETPESSGKKGDHLIGDYYVAFDKHYKAEVKELTAQYQAEGLNEEEAKAKAEANSPLMLEAREMLRKWEANDPEIRALWKKMNDWVYAGFDETYKMMGVSFDKIYYESNTYLEGKEKVMEGLEKGCILYCARIYSTVFSVHLWREKSVCRCSDGSVGRRISRVVDQPEEKEAECTDCGVRNDYASFFQSVSRAADGGSGGNVYAIAVIICRKRCCCKRKWKKACSKNYGGASWTGIAWKRRAVWNCTWTSSG